MWSVEEEHEPGDICSKVAVINKVLVVCTGNVCRSPMAQGLLRDSFDKKNTNTTNESTVRSCGLSALVGQPAVSIAVELMQARGIDISEHRAQQIDPEKIDWADLILVMEQTQLEEIQGRVPSSRGKVFRLGHYSDIDIPDPYSRTKQEFIRALRMIENCVAEWIQEIDRSEAAIISH